MVKVSVILTTCNSAKSIRSTLNSIYGQEGLGKLFELEVIAVDDCSVDETPAILGQYPLTLLSTKQNSGGPNRGRNMGLDHATGEYICFVDHDDQWAPKKIMLQLKAADLAPVISTLHKVVDQRRGMTFEPASRSVLIQTYARNETFCRKLSRNRTGQTGYFSTLMIHRSLKHIRFEEHFGMLDYDWYLKIMHHQYTVEVNQCLMTRFVDGYNLSLNAEYRRRDYYMALLMLESYEKTYPVLVRSGVKKLNGSRGRYHYLEGDMPSARKYLLKSSWNPIMFGYYLTTFLGARWVRSSHRIFG